MKGLLVSIGFAEPFRKVFNYTRRTCSQRALSLLISFLVELSQEQTQVQRYGQVKRQGALDPSEGRRTR